MSCLPRRTRGAGGRAPFRAPAPARHDRLSGTVLRLDGALMAWVMRRVLLSISALVRLATSSAPAPAPDRALQQRGCFRVPRGRTRGVPRQLVLLIERRDAGAGPRPRGLRGRRGTTRSPALKVSNSKLAIVRSPSKGSSFHRS